jgi:protein-S-isoprenylcysteine O-methyltransferase Ste14
MDLSLIINIVSVFWLGSEIILYLMKRSLPTDKRFDRSSIRVLWITILVCVTAGVMIGIQRVGYVGGGSRIFPTTGLILIICGLLIRWIAIFYLRSQFTVDVAITKGHKIVSHGIYRFVRHPTYSGILLSFLGLGICFGNVFSFVVIFIPVCAAFLYRIRVEERALILTFGDDYVRYSRSTKRLIPGLF